MKEINIIEVKEDLKEINSIRAEKLRAELKEKNVFLLNVMSSPGSGKTTLLVNLINRLKDKFNILVLEADIDGDVDAKTISDKTGVPSYQVHTGGTCHLTAQMVNDALNHVSVDNINLIILENIGNLVCPAEFDTGANMNMVLLSTNEGDDKPLKYPLMFEVASIVVITKCDVKCLFDFDTDRARTNINKRKKDINIFEVSALADKGIEPLEEYLTNRIKKELGE